MFEVFEYPWGLLVVAVASFVVIWIVRAVVSKVNRWWQVFVPVVIALCAFWVDFAVRTDREQIKGVVISASQAFEDEDIDGLGGVVSESYSDSFHRSKKMLMRRLGRRLSQPLIERNITRVQSIEQSGGQASVIFTVNIIFEETSSIARNYKNRILTRVQANLRKEGDRWLITQIELINIDLQAVGWKDVQNVNW